MPPGIDDNTGLSFGDLKLLMDNYQNMIQLNTVLLEQQKHVIELQHEIIRRQDSISIKQNTTCNKLDNIATTLATCVSTLQETIKNTTNSCADIESNLGNKVGNTGNKVDSLHLDMVKQHSKITNKIYVALGGSVLVILALVGLLITAYGKYDVLTDIHEMVQRILLFFNLG